MKNLTELEAIIAEAIMNTNKAAPIIEPGLMLDDLTRPAEDSLPQARQVIKALTNAGYEIRKKA